MNKITRFATLILAMGCLVPAMAQNQEGKKDASKKESKVSTVNIKETEKKSDNKPADKKASAQLYGFVRNYGCYDSRQTYYVCGGEYNMMPKDEDWNMSEAQAEATQLDRYDLNDVDQFHLLALTTRIGLNLTGPGIWGAKSSTGKIEGDFAGFSTTNSVFRIRQAWAQLNWEKGQLLVGQTWHPLSGDIMPEVLGMAAGAPFRCHSRTPQVRYIYYNGNFGFTAAALSQLQYMNNGPSGNFSSTSSPSWTSTNSTSFAYNAIVPEMFLGVNFKNSKIYAQIGADMQVLRPRTWGVQSVTNEENVTTYYKVPVNETLTSVTPTAYFQYTEGLFALKFRSMIAQNTSHLNQLVGYGISGVNPDGSWNYTPMQASISYLNFAYGKTVRADLFFGYMQNLGSTQDLTKEATGNYMIFSKGNYTNIQNMWRIAPSISYNTKAFNIGLEYELTAVGYGNKGTMNANGTFDAENVHNVMGHRICALVKYNF